MPNHDGTGPEGNGPKTGRGLGKCGRQQPMPRGRGARRGRGQGWRCWREDNKEE